MKLTDYAIVVLPLADEDGGGFAALVPDLPGCISDGGTHEEAIRNVHDAIASWLDTAESEGREIPQPGDAVEAEPESNVYLKTLGGILYRAGRLEEAARRLAEANDLIEEPDSRSASTPAYTWYLLAMVHHELAEDA